MKLQLLRLNPLRSRLAIPFLASIFFISTSIHLTPGGYVGSHFAVYAAEIKGGDHNHHWIGLEGRNGPDDTSSNHGDYEASFVGYERSIIGERQDSGPVVLSNNVRTKIELGSGQVYNAVFGNTSTSSRARKRAVAKTGTLSSREQLGDNSQESAQSGLERRQASTQGSAQFYFTVSTCSQPTVSGSSGQSSVQLTLYISTSDKNISPGPKASPDTQAEVSFDAGYARYKTNATGNIYIAVSAPTLPEGSSGNWSAEIVASTDGSFFDTEFMDNSQYGFMDSDNNSALFWVNLTNRGLSTKDSPPFTVYAFPKDDSPIDGLQKSFCGLQTAFASQPGLKTEIVSTEIGVNKTVMEQIYISGFNASTNYVAYFVEMANASIAESNSTSIATVGGSAHKVIQIPEEFSTKSDGNCQILYNLDFCTSVSYAVPANPDSVDITKLRELYDGGASDMYDNFQKSLAQIACHTTNTAQYSLARNCTDCANAYKEWLCAVTIPRCADFLSPKTSFPVFQPRNVAATYSNGSSLPEAVLQDDNASPNRTFANQSRNPMIDKDIKPGPYKEMLPCEDLCYQLVQSCPARLGFGCPLPNKGLERSYGRMESKDCNYPGRIKWTDAAMRSMLPRISIVTMVVIAVSVILTVV